MATYAIDPAHTDISFSAKHMMVTTVRGKFRDVEGSLEIDEADPAASTGELRVRAASLSTGFDARDQHLRSADFFDAEHHPEIVFRATTVEARGRDRFAVTGDVTIRDVTRPVTFDVELLGFYTGMSGVRRIGLTARATVNRKDWGLNWNVALEAGGWLVGDEIRLEIDVAAELASRAEDAAA
jgi:polyisoprenoid-binding protein YceI